MYLADVFTRRKKEWTELGKGVQEFGKEAGLFDEISIKRLGRRDSDHSRFKSEKLEAN